MTVKDLLSANALQKHTPVLKTSIRAKSPRAPSSKKLTETQEYNQTKPKSPIMLQNHNQLSKKTDQIPESDKIEDTNVVKI